MKHRPVCSLLRNALVYVQGNAFWISLLTLVVLLFLVPLFVQKRTCFHLCSFLSGCSVSCFIADVLTCHSREKAQVLLITQTLPPFHCGASVSYVSEPTRSSCNLNAAIINVIIYTWPFFWLLSLLLT